MIKQTQTTHQRYWNIGLAVICIILFFALFSLMVDERRDNQRETQYQEKLMEYEGVRLTMVDGANKLYRSLKECREEVKNGIN